MNNIDNKNISYGVILVNLGSPAAPTKKAVKDFLVSFLSDIRVVDKPRWWWLPLLRGVIIPARLGAVTKAYRSIWTEAGSPLIAISAQQQHALQTMFAEDSNAQSAVGLSSPVQVQVELAMTYNQPSILNALTKMQAKNINKVVILPLYPQYSSTTTAAVFDVVAQACKSFKQIPDLRFVEHYYQHPQYIKALAESIRPSFTPELTDQKLLFSFHGLPQRIIEQGDPYQDHCQQTAQLVAQELGLTDEQWALAYQSRVGREPWLQPYFDRYLAALPNKGCKNVVVVCPAFSADCLETLEEINIENRELFMENGGESYVYVPALNANSDHIAMMHSLVMAQISGWH